MNQVLLVNFVKNLSFTKISCKVHSQNLHLGLTRPKLDKNWLHERIILEISEPTVNLPKKGSKFRVYYSIVSRCNHLQKFPAKSIAKS